MKHYWIVALCLTSLSAPLTALADYDPVSEPRVESAGDYYLTFLGGLSAFDSTKLESSALFTMSGIPGRISYENGYHAGFSFGYYFFPANLRLEGQYLFSRASFKNVSVGGISIDTSGSTQVHALLMNALYEFTNIGINAHPYLGAGISVNHVRLLPDNFPTENHTRFGYQVLGGMLFHIKEDFALDLSYRSLFITGIPNVDGNFTVQHLSIGITFNIADTLS